MNVIHSIRGTISASVALSLLVAGCGPTLSQRTETNCVRLQTACDASLSVLAGNDRARAVEVYGRLAARMTRDCAWLEAGASADGAHPNPGQNDIENAVASCVRVAALQLRAVGVDAFAIATANSQLAPDAIPANEERGLRRLRFACHGVGGEGSISTETAIAASQASGTACSMLGDIEWVMRGRVHTTAVDELFGKACRQQYSSAEDQASIEPCIRNAPTRPEARWLTAPVRIAVARATLARLDRRPAAARDTLTGVTALIGDQSGSESAELRAQVETLRARLPPAVASAAPGASSPPSASDAAEASSPPSAAPIAASAEPPSAPAPAAIAQWSCAGAWDGWSHDSGRHPLGRNLRVELDPSHPDRCGVLTSLFTDGNVNTYRFTACALENNTLRATGEGEFLDRTLTRHTPGEPITVTLSCRGARATLVIGSTSTRLDRSRPPTCRDVASCNQACARDAGYGSCVRAALLTERSYAEDDARRLDRDRRASELYATACRRGAPLACHRAQSMMDYRDGDGRAPLAELACAGGVTSACRSLAEMLSDPQTEGLAMDLPRARRLLASNCERGDWYACHLDATLLRRGRGAALAPNPAAAYAMMDRTCSAGGADLAALRSSARESVILSMEAPDVYLQRRYDERVAGDALTAIAFACEAAGEMRERGEGIARDATAARAAYERSCAARSWDRVCSAARRLGASAAPSGAPGTAR